MYGDTFEDDFGPEVPIEEVPEALKKSYEETDAMTRPDNMTFAMADAIRWRLCMFGIKTVAPSYFWHDCPHLVFAFERTWGEEPLEVVINAMEVCRPHNMCTATIIVMNQRHMMSGTITEALDWLGDELIKYGVTC